MLLDQYVQHLVQLMKDNPQTKGYVVMTSSDDEGNSFGPVNYAPCTGRYEDGEFTTEHTEQHNVVCLN